MISSYLDITKYKEWVSHASVTKPLQKLFKVDQWQLSTLFCLMNLTRVSLLRTHESHLLLKKLGKFYLFPKLKIPYETFLSNKVEIQAYNSKIFGCHHICHHIRLNHSRSFWNWNARLFAKTPHSRAHYLGKDLSGWIVQINSETSLRLGWSGQPTLTNDKSP